MKLSSLVPIQRSFAVLAWEKAVPAFLPLVVAGFVVAALLWTGGLARLPGEWHVAALAALAALGMFLLIRGTRMFRFPTKRETLRRLEQRNDLPAGTLDSVWAEAFGGDDASPLWLASRERLRQTIGHPKPPLPRLSLRPLDPLFLRFVAPLVFASVLVGTGGQRDGLIASLKPDLADPRPIIIDAWVEQPSYTGLSPVVLKAQQRRVTYQVPGMSLVHLHVRDEQGQPLRSIVTFEPEDGRRARLRPDETGEIRQSLDQSGVLTVTARGQSRAIRFAVVPDRAPTVTLAGEPKTATGALRLTVATDDDYQLTDAKLIVTLLPGQKISRDAPVLADEVAERSEVFALPSLVGPTGEFDVEIETESHPWAGLLVKAKIEVTDGRGQMAETPLFAFTMPERTFYNPMSQAVIEERRKLAMAPSSFSRAAQLFGALVEAPDLFDVAPSEHLMLKATAEALAAAKRRDVDSLIESLWPLAIELEDDGLTLARAELEAAEQALRDALENGASQEEIRQRIADLREAMNRYIQALAESGLAETDLAEGEQALGTGDLDSLLDQLESLSAEGAREEAAALLAQLEALLNGLQLSQGGGGQGSSGSGQGQSGGAGSAGADGNGQEPGEGALSGTGDLMQRQRELADETFSARRGDRGTRGLGEDQGSLADDLESLREGLEGDAAGAAEAFEDAERVMRRAAEALEDGNLGTAQRLQEQALNALSEAGNALAELLADAGDGGGDEAGTITGTDPFGRAYDGEGGPLPEDFGLYDPERIRALIAEIRERLRDPNLGEAEREYLESLLERF